MFLRRIIAKLSASKYLIITSYIFVVLALFLLGRFALNAVADEQVSIFFNPSSSTMPPDETLNLMVNSGAHEIAFVHIEMVFDPTQINLSDEILTTSSLATVVQKTSMTDANSTGQITIALGLSTGDVDNPPVGEFTYAQLPLTTVTGEENVLSEITITTQEVQVVDVNETELTYATEDASFILNPVDPTETPTPTTEPTTTATPTPSPTPTDVLGDSSSTTLSFSEPGTQFVNEDFQVDVNFETDTSVSGVDAVVNYDPSYLTLNQIQENTLLSENSQTLIDNDLGIARISQTVDPGGGFSGQGILATLFFTPDVPGDTTLSFEYSEGATNESNAIASSDGSDILAEPQSLSLSIIEHATIDLQLLTAGSDHSTTGTLSVEGDGFSYDFETDSSGQSEEITLPDELIGQEVDLLVKVNGYLRKRHTMNILSGHESINLGILLAGDLNDDGVVNTLDLAIMYDAWFGTGAADYNGDGIVNSADHWILISNFLEEDE